MRVGARHKIESAKVAKGSQEMIQLILNVYQIHLKVASGWLAFSRRRFLKVE